MGHTFADDTVTTFPYVELLHGLNRAQNLYGQRCFQSVEGSYPDITNNM